MLLGFFSYWTCQNEPQQRLCYEHHRVMSIYDENKNFTLVIYRLYVSRGCGLVKHVLATSALFISNDTTHFRVMLQIQIILQYFYKLLIWL